MSFEHWLIDENLCLPKGWTDSVSKGKEGEFVQQLNAWTTENKVACPRTSISLERACVDFKKLCETNAPWCVQLWYHRLLEEAHFGLVIPQTRVGGDCSRFFNTNARMATPGNCGPSVHQMWDDPVA
jgi:hypothetical protein